MKSPTFFACGLLTSLALLNSVCGPALALPALIAPRANLVAAARGPIVLPATPTPRNVRDLGRAEQTLPVRVALTLRYQHEPELQRLIEMLSDRRSQYYHRFLSNLQFADYFAPLPAQEAAVVATLSRAGFAVTKRYANCTIVDAVAPAATAERYFSTEIHQFVQPAHGIRYATVKPAVIPAELTGAVETVSGLSNIVRARPQFAFANPTQKTAAQARAIKLSDGLGARLVGTRVAGWRRPVPAAPTQVTGNILADPSFESGQFGAWQQYTTVPDASIQNLVTHSGKYAVFVGTPTATGGEINGDSGIAQPVTIPANGVLSFWARGSTNESNSATSWQEGDLLDDTGLRLVNFFAVARSAANWTHVSFNVSASAGKRVFLYFGVHGNGDVHHRTTLYIDDVSLSGSSFGVRGAPIGGPLTGPDGGYGPVIVADDYDLPVQHGLDGAGRATGITISGDYSDRDLETFLRAFGITRGGTTTRVEVDGGAKYNPLAEDTIEATLDAETIVSLAPATHLYMYLIPDLGDVSILDGYNQAVSDNAVDVVNSSFAGCEISGDRGWNLGLYRLAAQGAAKGITFSGSSGDQGSTGCTDSFGLATTGVEEPASIPDFVAVGGTSLYTNSDGSYQSESAWSGSTGGLSAVWGIPPYQVNFAGISGTARHVPDLSFPADPATGTSLYLGGAWQGPIGGTSWSSPIFCAMQTEIDQRDNSRFGFVNPAIYNAFSKDGGYRLFNDIVDGTNGDYNAGRGYDLVTGIGSPHGSAFASAE